MWKLETIPRFCDSVSVLCFHWHLRGNFCNSSESQQPMIFLQKAGSLLLKKLTNQNYSKIRVVSLPHQKQSNWTMFLHELTYNTFLVISSSNLSQVTVVVSFHFQIENFAFCLRSIRDQKLFQERLKGKQRTQCFEHMLNQQFNYISIYFKVKTASLLTYFLHILHNIVS